MGELSEIENNIIDFVDKNKRVTALDVCVVLNTDIESTYDVIRELASREYLSLEYSLSGVFLSIGRIKL